LEFVEEKIDKKNEIFKEKIKNDEKKEIKTELYKDNKKRGKIIKPYIDDENFLFSVNINDIVIILNDNDTCNFFVKIRFI
jgi:hypothetical protein